MSASMLELAQTRLDDAARHLNHAISMRSAAYVHALSRLAVTIEARKVRSSSSQRKA